MAMLTGYFDAAGDNSSDYAVTTKADFREAFAEGAREMAARPLEETADFS